MAKQDDTKPAPEKEGADEKPPYSEEEMLILVQNEMRRSVGFENDQTLTSERLRALNYYKGDVTMDIASLPNRSAVVSTDVSDAVETVLPDLMEIFTGGSDVAAFIPMKQSDEEAAKQETDYLTHVIFQDNPGFLNLYTGFKDALLLKTCVFECAWKQDIQDEDFTGKTAVEVLLAHQSGKVVNVEQEEADPDYPDAQPTFKFSVREDCSKAEYWALPPDDFSVSPDTVRISDTTYCVARYRPRIQDLLDEGYDEDKVRDLESYAPVSNQQIQQSRDTAGEHEQSQDTDDSSDILRQVEIRKHYIKLRDDDGDFDLWRVVTNASAESVIAIEKVQRIPFTVGSPYLVAHRLYGMSLAEQLFEIQKIKTVLTRGLLDTQYFTLNSRMEVAMEQAGDYTISDLLRNEPGVPIRSKSGNAVRPVMSGGMSFDSYAALEYFSTVGESRTGVVRNAQGLNPDTLHDTAKGAMALMQAAQRRVRMIARILAETCIKELYLGLHALIRENAESSRVAKLNGKWVDIDPTSWGERNAMSIEVGLGASGRDADLAAMGQLANIMGTIVQQQGGADGPLVTMQNVYNAAVDFTKALGRKQPERYFTDPSQQPQQQGQPLDPKVITELQKQQAAREKAQADNATKQRGQDISAQLKMTQLQGEEQLKEYEIDQKTQADIVTSAMTAHAHSAEPKVGTGIGKTI